jgi:hypothetical protein
MNVLRAVTTSLVMMALFCFSVPVAVRIPEACPLYELTPRNAVKNTTMYRLFRSEPAHVVLLHGVSIRTASTCKCRPENYNARFQQLSTSQGGTNAHGARDAYGPATGTITSFMCANAQIWQMGG